MNRDLARATSPAFTALIVAIALTASPARADGVACPMENVTGLEAVRTSCGAARKVVRLYSPKRNKLNSGGVRVGTYRCFVEPSPTSSVFVCEGPKRRRVSWYDVVPDGSSTSRGLGKGSRVAGARGRADCRVSPKAVVAQNRHGLIYRDPASGAEPYLYACTRFRRRGFLEEDPWFPGAVALRGTRLAYGYRRLFDFAGDEARIDVLALRDIPENGAHRTLRSIAVPEGPMSQLVFTDSLGLAWISCSYPDGGYSAYTVTCTKRMIFRVFKADAGADYVQLDRGRAIDPDSLRLRGNTLTWANGRQQKSAVLR